jgi:hypothetical protein
MRFSVQMRATAIAFSLPGRKPGSAPAAVGEAFLQARRWQYIVTGVTGAPASAPFCSTWSRRGRCSAWAPPSPRSLAHAGR